MATVINNPSTENTGMNSFIVGALLLLLVVFLFFYYGLPALRDASQYRGSGATPEQVDVNVNQNPAQ